MVSSRLKLMVLRSAAFNPEKNIFMGRVLLTLRRLEQVVLGAPLKCYVDVFRCDMAVDQLWRDCVHRVFGRPSGHGRPRVADPVAGFGPRPHLATAHRSAHVQPQLQRDDGSDAARGQTQRQQFHVSRRKTKKKSVGRIIKLVAYFQGGAQRIHPRKVHREEVCHQNVHGHPRFAQRRGTRHPQQGRAPAAAGLRGRSGFLGAASRQRKHPLDWRRSRTTFFDDYSVS